MHGASPDLLATNFIMHSMVTQLHHQNGDHSIYYYRDNLLLTSPPIPFSTMRCVFLLTMNMVPSTTLTLFHVPLPLFPVPPTFPPGLKISNSLPTFTFFHHLCISLLQPPTPLTHFKHSLPPSLPLFLHLRFPPFELLLTLMTILLVSFLPPLRHSPPSLISPFLQFFPLFPHLPLSRFHYALRKARTFVGVIVVASSTSVFQLPLHQHPAIFVLVTFSAHTSQGKDVPTGSAGTLLTTAVNMGFAMSASNNFPLFPPLLLNLTPSIITTLYGNPKTAVFQTLSLLLPQTLNPPFHSRLPHLSKLTSMTLPRLMSSLAYAHQSTHFPHLFIPTEVSQVALVLYTPPSYLPPLLPGVCLTQTCTSALPALCNLHQF
jgi:hypothetical protein